MPGIADILSLGTTLDAAKVLCIFLHGRNQTPEEMEATVIGRLSARDVAFALPRAGAATWYAAKAVDPLTDATRAELAQSLADLAGAIASLRAAAPKRPLLIAGFSQGACLSLELAFAGTSPPDAVAALTGCRVGTAACQRAGRLAPNLPVYLTGGSSDPWIPVAAFSEAATELGRARAVLRADIFPDRPHEVSAPEIAMLDGMLTDLALGRTPRMEAPR